MIVFVGPTLPADEVRRLLPGAEVRPPAAVGDILDLPRRAGAIALIDGYFERMAAPWHKEILLAMERGVAVYGAASMGALRAAELAPFGMVGVGVVYRWFARGVLEADDEVAVAHLPAEHGYRPVTDALVNLRAGIAAAPMLSASIRPRLVELARARFYRERTWGNLIADARAAGISRRALDGLARWPKPDRKAMDARLLLRRLASGRGPKPEARRPSPFRVPRTWALQQLLAGAWR